MKRWTLISILSICITILMIALAWIIPGFPLLLFIALPPLFCWGTQEQPESEAAEGRSPKPLFCSQCGKQLLEPFESYCPRCGAPIPQTDD
jgi:hypothetical protein